MAVTIYLDHNVLDASLKGRIKNLTELVASKYGVAVYSKESLFEIRKSKGHERQFLSLLTQLEALYLDVDTTLEGRITGNYQFRASDPFIEFEKLEEALSDFVESNFGLDKLQQKFYGGGNDTSFTEIAEEGLSDLVGMLDKTLTDCREELPQELVSEIGAKFSELKQRAASSMVEMGHLLDGSKSETTTLAFEKAVGVGPKQLKNIQPPNVLHKVWGMLSPSLSAHMSFDQFFGLAPTAASVIPPQFGIEKANAIYHALNYAGYYRDEGMKRLRRVHATSSDMTHVGYAAVCDWLVSGDLDLVMKARAAYEYLGIATKVEHVEIQALERLGPFNASE